MKILLFTRVKKMQPRFQNYPEFMVECSLFDIIPPDTVSLDLSVRLKNCILD